MAKKAPAVVMATPEGRLSFPQVFEPKKGEKPGDKEKFSATILLDKKDPRVQAWLGVAAAEIQRIVVEEWPSAQGRPDINTLPKALKDGDTLTYEKGAKRGQLKKLSYPEMAGCWVLQTSGIRKPQVLDKTTGQEIHAAAALESGMLVKLGCHFYVMNNQNYCGISCGLDSVLFVRDDGVRFASVGPAATETFKNDIGVADAIASPAVNVAQAQGPVVKQAAPESMFG